jgi:hypothetical protein
LSQVKKIIASMKHSLSTAALLFLTYSMGTWAIQMPSLLGLKHHTLLFDTLVGAYNTTLVSFDVCIQIQTSQAFN